MWSPDGAASTVNTPTRALVLLYYLHEHETSLHEHLALMSGAPRTGEATTPCARANSSPAARVSPRVTRSASKSGSKGRRDERSPPPRRSSRSRSPATSPCKTSRRNIAAELDGENNGSAESAGAAEVRQDTSVRTRQTFAHDHVDTHANIQMIQWYILCVAGIEVNLGKLQKTSQNEEKLKACYVRNAQGVAAHYWSFSVDKHGGDKNHQWMHGRDAAWLEKRLIHRDNGLATAIDGRYLWSQWKDNLRTEIENEAMVAFNMVTNNGTNFEISGGDAMTVHDRFMQAWYECNLDRSKGKKAPSEIKKQSIESWQKFQPGDATAAICPLPYLGHGDDCPYGRAPPKIHPPKSYLAFIAMGPLADIMREYYDQFEQPACGWFPPLKTDPGFNVFFTTNKSKSGPPEADPRTGGAQKESAGIDLSRSAARLDDQDGEDQGWQQALTDACRANMHSGQAAAAAGQAEMLNAQVNLINSAANVQPGSKQAILADKLMDKILKSLD